MAAFDPKQMMMQAIMGRMTQNPLTQQVLQMKNQGMTPQQAIQQLGQQYPQLRQLQGMNPAKLDGMAMNAMRQTGIDPNTFVGQFKRML